MKDSLYGKITAYLIGVVLVTTCILLFENVYMFKLTYNQLSQGYQNSLEQFGDGLDSELSNAKDYLNSFALTTDAQNFSYLQGNHFFETQRMKESIDNALLAEKYISGMWIYSDNTNQSIWSRNSNRTTFQQLDMIKQMYSESSKLDEANNRWALIENEGNQYFVYYCYSDGVCYGAWCSVNNVLHNTEGLFGSDFLVSLTQEKSVKANIGEVMLDYELLSLPKVYIEVVGIETILTKVSQIPEILVVVSVLCLSFMMVLIINMKKYLFRPVSEITRTINEIGTGNLEVKVDTSGYVKEMREIGDNLNYMTKNFKQLKIEVYEEQLKKKDALLQFQNSQIKPHFMLNIINTIYSMASVGEDNEIMKMCRYLSDYMRYLFTSKEMTCTLNEEVKHLKEYLLIQESRFPEEINCNLEMEPRIMDCMVPTMVLHTLVENSFKYAMGGTERLQLEIKGEYDKKNERVNVFVIDNGPGFPKDIMDSINNGCFEKSDSKGNVGIRNLIQRFREMYGNTFEMHIYNKPNTIVCLAFPYKQ